MSALISISIIVVIFHLFPSLSITETDSKLLFFKPLIEKYQQAGGDTAFIKHIILHPNTEFDKKYLIINVTGFMKKPDYSHFSNSKSVNSANSYLKLHEDKFAKVEELFGIPKQIIAAIIWIETRNGDYLGKNHIPSVFLSAAMADQPEFLQMNLEKMKMSFFGTADSLKALETKVRERSKKKADWALNELIALERMSKEMNIDVCEIYGSYAGAFGLSQFLPSSFINWSFDGDSSGTVDLFTPADAIFSVANYLKINGWSDTDSSQHAAVFHYNNSQDYVNAVFTLASKLY